MSHPLPKDSFTRSAPSPLPSASVSPLNALSHQPGPPYASRPSHTLLNNRLIPRDYLTARSKPTTGADGINTRSSPLVSETGLSVADRTPASAPDALAAAAREHRAVQDRSRPVPKDRASISDNDDIDGDGDGDLTRGHPRSPESGATGASVDSSTVGSRTTAGLSSRSQPHNMPRTSSIDSALSSVSAGSQHRKDQGEAREPSPSRIQGLITTAGSAEHLIVHLLKEKNHAATQNNQLWKLVEKQRALLLGLNKDLERVTKDRDRYRRKLKELQAQGTLPPPLDPLLAREIDESHGPNAVQPPAPSNDGTPVLAVVDSPPDDAPGPAMLTALEPTPQPDAGPPRAALQAQTAGLAQPSFALTEATPLVEKPPKGFSASRKAAPKPLNLLQHQSDPGPPIASNAAAADGPTQAEGEDEDEDEDEQRRGRRKTREEDDQDREKSLAKEHEARSKSAKKKPPSAPESDGPSVLVPPNVAVPLPASPRPQQAPLPGAALPDRLGPGALRSPGLPASPRPMNSAFSALPLSPRAAPPGPLSPRAPKQPIPPPLMSPSPFTDPAIIQRQNALARQAAQQSYQPPDRLQVHDPTASSEIPSVYQGLVSAQYPNLLLPPNALPSIQVKVASSRLQPSRHSMLGLRAQEDSTVFSLSVFSRASRNELWRIEKIPAVLPQLEQQLRPRCKDLPRLPDRKLFTGHSPAVIDARRQAIDQYFDGLLDLEMDELSALIICKFLSTDVLDPFNEPRKHPGVNQDSLPQSTSLSGKVVKTGYLTKRGKNFGGWKSRYFVLDSPELRYYETPGGPHLGTIKILHSKIGSQRPEDQSAADGDDQYRHAFLIREPKKKDSGTYVRHVLCAESDADRDEWVSALLHYVEASESKGHESPAKGAPPPFPDRPTTAGGKDRPVDSHSNASSPSSPISVVEGADPPTRTNHISAPMNGTPIHNTAQWGNKTTPPTGPKEKSKMGNIFHFRKSSQENLQHAKQAPDAAAAAAKPRILRHNGYVRAVFGLPLAEAVEFCAPFSVDVQLPAVVYRTIEYLRFRKAANEEGLFRLSGSNVLVKTLKERFNTEGDVDLVDDEEHYDVHAVASLFKTYLRELPSPILTRDLHIEFLKVLELDSQADKVAAFGVLVHQLPAVNFHLLRTMAEYLLEVTENSDKNKMTIRNIGIVFSPTVNIPTPVFNLFLSEFEAIFDRDPRDAAVQQAPGRPTQLRAPAGLSPEEIRSPRHQMFSHIPTPAYSQATFPPQEASGGPSKGHQASGSGEFGFTPLHPSYENGSYVTNPHDQHPRTQAYAPPMSQMQQRDGEEQFGSLNRMLVPQGASSDKRRKRESAMY